MEGLKDFCCIDFDNMACLEENRKQKDGKAQRAADVVAIHISECNKATLYIIEIIRGTLNAKEYKSKKDQINTTLDILKQNILFRNFIENHNDKVKKFVLCEKKDHNMKVGHGSNAYPSRNDRILVIEEDDLKPNSKRLNNTKDKEILECAYKLKKENY